MIRCPQEGCGSLVVYDDEFHHQIGCPHASYTCTEPGYAFAASPVGLLCHVVSDHSIPVYEFRYGVPTLFFLPVPAQGSSCRLHFCYREDGSVFALTIGALGPTTDVSMVCLTSAAWLWPQYTVTMWAKGPGAATGSSMEDYSKDIVKAVMEVKSSTSPGELASEGLTLYLPVPPRYLVGARQSKHIAFRVCIDKKNRSYSCCVL